MPSEENIEVAASEGPRLEAMLMPLLFCLGGGMSALSLRFPFFFSASSSTDLGVVVAVATNHLVYEVAEKLRPFGHAVEDAALSRSTMAATLAVDPPGERRDERVDGCNNTLAHAAP